MATREVCQTTIPNVTRMTPLTEACDDNNQ